MLIYIERELKLLLRDAGSIAAVVLLAFAVAAAFSGSSYWRGLVANTLIASPVIGYISVIREEEAGTLDGLRLLASRRKVLAAKLTASLVVVALSNAAYTAAHMLIGGGPADPLALAVATYYGAVVSTISAAVALGARARPMLTAVVSSGLYLGFALAYADGPDAPASAAASAVLTAILLSFGDEVL
ncbi:hypothetical protein TUZN_1090 [Thermoproteus uzoniensis 768-20]|uniref:Uncharacterized protein n=1 Tax=Thermoproteus uzoniensis (strain 768-20) TaxID=999630 RepID=F2L088_THEU7|nr:hypothetical protein [Thermoproteus uzoniensis]AEA12570.1 hypothetical protein TUZN_1090 [Thermoproteus uzoniensis 768-20]